MRKPRLGQLPQRYQFALNPRAEYRASTCPNCDQRTYPRKFALLIHVNPQHLIAMGFTCRYCPKCELIITHQDELEAQLTALFEERDPSAIGNDYFVIGTVELKVWKASLSAPKMMDEILEHTADFNDYRTIEHFPGGWYPKDLGETPFRTPPMPSPRRSRARHK